MDYRIAVCDDEPIFIEKIKHILLDCEIDGFTDSGRLLQALEDGRGYDVIFLDIAMPGLDGIGLAREIRETDEDVIIVFVTSRVEFMQTGYGSGIPVPAEGAAGGGAAGHMDGY